MNTYDLDIYKGQTFTLSLTVKDDNNAPIDLTGRTISGYLKTRYSDTGKLTDLNATIVNASSGILSLGISAPNTAVLPVNYAFYDVEMYTSGDGSVTKILAGKASIYPEVTF
jgi:hypothetical protein